MFALGAWDMYILITHLSEQTVAPLLIPQPEAALKAQEMLLVRNLILLRTSYVHLNLQHSQICKLQRAVDMSLSPHPFPSTLIPHHRTSPKSHRSLFPLSELQPDQVIREARESANKISPSL